MKDTLGSKSRVFSAVQPTGALHLGNYFGAVARWVESQGMYDSMFAIANLHSITLPKDAKVLREDTLSLVITLLASGLDPKKCVLFVQSDVLYHEALAWVLMCNISMGEMSRMTQYKDKSAAQKAPNVGLFNYPALMAADILLYDTDLVPVGSDQKQHLELTRNVALAMNKRYGMDLFKIPEPLISKELARVMSLTSPDKKMSKSDTSANGAIYLSDPPDVVVKKLKKATTDTDGKIAFDASRPGIYNLLCIYKALSGKDEVAIEEHFCHAGYGALKLELADMINSLLAPIQGECKRLAEDLAYVEGVLEKGAKVAKERAAKKYAEVRAAVGI